MLKEEVVMEVGRNIGLKKTVLEIGVLLRGMGSIEQRIKPYMGYPLTSIDKYIT